MHNHPNIFTTLALGAVALLYLCLREGKKKVTPLLCWLELHDWKYDVDRTHYVKTCRRCMLVRSGPQ